MKITSISAYQIFDSRGTPTIEAEVTLENGLPVPTVLQVRAVALQVLKARPVLTELTALMAPLVLPVLTVLWVLQVLQERITALR